MRNEPENITSFFINHDEIDMIALERRARELRAQAFAEMMRSLGSWVLRRSAAMRPAGSSQHV